MVIDILWAMYVAKWGKALAACACCRREGFHLRPDEMGQNDWFIRTLQLYFCHEQAFVVAMKLIYLPHVSLIVHNVAHLVDPAPFAQLQHLQGVRNGYLTLKLITR